MTSPIDLTELLRRLNDGEEQAMGYPAIDDYEDHIDFAATDVLHGWRDSEAGTGDSLFADAFANAFRVLVLAGGQQVVRRTGRKENRWVWDHTGHIAGWTVASYPADDSSGHVDEQTGKEAGYYSADRERWFTTDAEAAARVREIASVADEHCRKNRIVVSGIEVCSAGGPSDTGGWEAYGGRVGATRGEGI